LAKRLAAAAALVVFAVCLLMGARVGNTFGKKVGRALLAMSVTLVIGLIAGAMLERSLDENLSGRGEKKSKTGTDSGSG
jgi:F0F1-type ATP synthase assembly protein I